MLVRGFALWGAIGAWFVHLNVSYLLVPSACRWGSSWPLHAVAFVSAVVSAVAGYVSWVVWTAAGREPHPARTNRTFLGGAGVAMSVLFTAAIAAVWLSTFAIDACA